MTSYKPVLVGSSRVRPNAMHPEWPTEPDPKDLEVALSAARSAKDAKKALKEAPKVALETTRRRLLAQRRKVAGGCCSTNLDWIDLVGELRRTYSKETDKTYTGAWIDGSCPVKDEPVVVDIYLRKGRYSRPHPACRKYRYCYMTFQAGEAS